MGNSESSPGDRSLSRRRLLKLSGAAAGGIALSSLYGSQLGVHVPRFGPRSLLAAPPANEYFERAWMRTDRPVVEGMISRTWMWGPEAFTGALMEPYAESPNGERTVQYFDKSRMEITHPDSGDPGSIWYVTNGLLVNELVTGRMQTGDSTFVDRTPAQVNVAGDGDDPNGPTYATFGPLLDAAPLAANSAITQRVDRAGNVTSDPALAGQGISTGIIDDVTNHSIAAPFWEFMNSSGLVYQNGGFVQDDLFENAYFATGRPTSEPYWADVKVAGTVKLVLMQCFERRCLTYTPGNPPGWLVEAGNVGLHYYDWRYGDDPDPDPPPPLPLGEFCVPVPEGFKPKTAPATKLQRLADTSVTPSTLASAFLQMGRRYSLGLTPGNELETAAFAAFANLPAATQDILGCSLEKLDELPPDIRNKLFDPLLDLSDTVVTPEYLATSLAMEVVMHASQTTFGTPECMTEERQGQKRITPGLDGAIVYTPTITRINDLRTIQYGIPLEQYLPAELEQTCTVVPIDGDGDGVPDSSQLNCQTQMAPCLGNSFGNVCMRIPEVRQGEMVVLTGANYYDVGAKVRFGFGETTSDVEAHVCGDITTPVTEIVDGMERVIRDNRVQDKLTFQVPLGFASGVYYIQVVVPFTNESGTFEELGFAEYIRIVAPPTATFEIASEELTAIAETSPASFGSDEVGLRIVALPIELDGTLGALMDHKFGGGTSGIFEDVDSGETRDISRVLFSRGNIAGVAMAIIGYEVDSESAYREQVEGFVDAFLFVMSSSMQAVANTLVGAVTAVVGIIIGLSAALITAIAAAIVAAIMFFVALWAPADLIIQDTIGLSALQLDELTSSNYPMGATQTYTTPGAIDVTVEPVEKIIHYRENRTYYSDDEESRYQISLRYSRTG